MDERQLVSMTFEEVWAEKEKEGYQYGEDALEQVRFGWELGEAERQKLVTKIEELEHLLNQEKRR